MQPGSWWVCSMIGENRSTTSSILPSFAVNSASTTTSLITISGLRLDPERPAHQRVDPAEIRVSADRQVRRGRPGRPAHGRRTGVSAEVAELARIELELAVRQRVGDAGRLV